MSERVTAIYLQTKQREINEKTKHITFNEVKKLNRGDDQGDCKIRCGFVKRATTQRNITIFINQVERK